MLWAVTAAVTVVTGLGYGARFPVTASLFMAVAAVAATAMFMAVGALCGQLAGTRRRAAAMAAAVFGAAYLIRLVAYADMRLMWLRWASPLGWVDELQPLTGSRPLALLPIAGFTAVLAAAAIALAGRRDLGASALPAGDTAAARTRLLTGPFGLACRLARRGALGWFAALAGGGLILGLTAKGTEAVFSGQSGGGVVARLGGTAGGAPYLGLGFLIIALMIAMAAAGQAAATRDEEAEGYLDHLLARERGRRRCCAADDNGAGRRRATPTAVIVLMRSGPAPLVPADPARTRPRSGQRSFIPNGAGCTRPLPCHFCRGRPTPPVHAPPYSGVYFAEARNVFTNRCSRGSDGELTLSWKPQEDMTIGEGSPGYGVRSMYREGAPSAEGSTVCFCANARSWSTSEADSEGR
jgi:hypothetical protein